MKDPSSIIIPNDGGVTVAGGYRETHVGTLLFIEALNVHGRFRF
jgi:hypothetical protein